MRWLFTTHNTFPINMNLFLKRDWFPRQMAQWSYNNNSTNLN